MALAWLWELSRFLVVGWQLILLLLQYLKLYVVFSSYSTAHNNNKRDDFIGIRKKPPTAVHKVTYLLNAPVWHSLPNLTVPSPVSHSPTFPSVIRHLIQESQTTLHDAMNEWRPEVELPENWLNVSRDSRLVTRSVTWRWWCFWPESLRVSVLGRGWKNIPRLLLLIL